jgi:WXG100 family type VII secretion target
MSIMQMIFGQVQSCVSSVSSQKGMAESSLNVIKGIVPKVEQGWIGEDADEFKADIQRKVIPAMTRLIMAIAGMSTNLTQAGETIANADQQAGGIANQIGDLFSSI